MKTKTKQNIPELWETAKPVLRRKFIAVMPALKKMNDLKSMT